MSSQNRKTPSRLDTGVTAECRVCGSGKNVVNESVGNVKGGVLRRKTCRSCDEVIEVNLQQNPLEMIPEKPREK